MKKLTALSRALILSSTLLMSHPVFAVEPPSKEQLTQFISRAEAQTGLTKDALASLLAQAEYKPRIIELMTKPGESMPWSTYKERIVNNERIQAGRVFMATYHDALLRAETQYGVPKEIIAAIIGVETKYGTNKGSFRIIDALYTLSFYYPRRADFFQQELIAFLALTKASQTDPLTVTGSYAGAIGWPQFMPSNAKRLAVDFDGDGRVDLVNSPVDAIGSIAHFLQEKGWARGAAVAYHDVPATESNLSLAAASGQLEYFRTEHNFQMIKRYNNSNLYALAVFLLSEQLASP